MALGNIGLRQLATTDNEAVAALANNRRVWDNLTDMMPHPYSVDDADTFIGMAIASETDRIFAIEYNGKLAGVTGLHGNTGVFRLTAELGYWIGEPFWNRGIATAAVKLLTHYGITAMGLVRIYANVYHFNTASQRVLEKAGYRFECVARKAAVKNGVIVDDHRYSFLDEDLKEGYLNMGI